MQNASKEYKESMRQPNRNRGYIRVSIGVVNSDAQKNVSADDSRNNFTYYSNTKNLFNGYSVSQQYATCERDFTKVDGSMYFLPKESSGMQYYNNGIVTQDFMGTIYIRFNTSYSLDIKGLKINWGEYYPIDFTIENDENIRSYEGNDKANWTTEDTFDGTTYLIIRVSKMANPYLRVRIHEFTAGISNTFTNQDVKSYVAKDFVSPIAETVPSQDLTLVVDNQNLYYSPDNPESALAYMEVGQEIKVEFGYDVTGNGDIEWLPEITTYLKNWSANDVEAKFVGTDRFDYLTDKYYKGHFYKDGITLYDLAVDVLADAGITDSREYFLDPYLQTIVVNNPIPIVTHASALQIIANAGRCALSVDRQKRIHLQSSFVPDMSIKSNGETDYSNVSNVMNTDEKTAYASASNDFTTVDGTLLFKPKNEADYLDTNGYVSAMVSDGNGMFEENPLLTLSLEASFIAYGLKINFRNTAPREFVIRTYNENVLVEEHTYKNPELDFSTNEQFDLFTRMEIEITKGYPLSRVFIDNIVVDNVTDYILTRNVELMGSPTATRQNKIKSINIERTVYSETQTENSNLKSEEIYLQAGVSTYMVYLTKPSYDYEVSVVGDNNEETTVNCTIKDSNNYYVELEFSNVETDNTIVKYTISGKEYSNEYFMVVVNHNDTGEVKEWRNPLISTVLHAKDLEEWLASYYLGDVVYQIPWRGDPRVDANDLFYLETKDRGNSLIRGYENTLNFDGGWSSTIKARKAVLSWRG
jgi:hypothetical protein